MLTAIVKFDLPEPVGQEEARAIFLNTAPTYRQVHGLLRKYYLLSPSGQTAGGVYLWQSQQHADDFYTESWKKYIEDKYGSPPVIEYLNSPVVVDNLSGEIVE